MTEFERFKKAVAEISDPAELVGSIDATRTLAMLYCRKNFPDEVTIENGELKNISIMGMIDYFESDTEES